MRSLISLSVAILLTLTAASTGRAGGQSRKSKAKARVSHRASQSKSKPSSTPTPATVPDTVEHQADGVRRMTPVEAREAVAQGKAVIVDVRGEDSYNAGHIKGARWINLNDIGSRTGELPRDKTIITYCA
jgi:3-mercaptopyruvate sulfurtransferase SseA